MRRLILPLMLLLVSCGGEEPPVETDPGGETGSPRGVAPDATPVSEVGAAGNASVRKEVPTDPDLRLTVRPPSVGFTPGRPFVALLTLRNVSRYTFDVYRPEESLRRDLYCLILKPDGTKELVRDEFEVDEDTIGPSHLVAFPPDADVQVQKNLEPFLTRLTRGRAGTYRVQLAFTGGHHGAAVSDRVWNPLHMKRVLAEPIEIRVAAGGPPPPDEVRRILCEPGPDGRLTGGARRKLLDAGPDVWPSVVGVLPLAASPVAEEQSAGWAAFELLREIGAPARPALDRAGETGGIQELLAVWMDIDAAGEGEEPPGAEFAGTILDPGTRSLQVFRLTRHLEPGASDAVTIHGDGTVLREIHEGEEVRALRGRLPGKETEEFLENLVQGTFWAQRGVRTAGREGESLLVFEWFRLEEFDGVWAQVPVRRFEVWEDESYLNVPLWPIVEAFRKAGDLTR